MHRDFSDWYRAVSLEPSAELAKRWQSVEAFAEAVSVSELAELTRLLYGLPLREPKFEEAFRAPFKKVDAAFSMNGNLPELRVLAGATLVRQFGYDGKWALTASLAIVCAGCQGMRPPPIPAMFELARADLYRQSETLRKQSAKSIAKLDVTETLKEVKAALEGNQLPSLAEPLSSTLQQLVTIVGELSSWANDVQTEQECRREESDVLWWLFGAHSRDLGLPFGTLKAPAVCLIAAKELSDLTRSLSGPYAAEAFLDNVIRAAHPTLKTGVALAEVLAACPKEWLNTLISAKGLDAVNDLCPVHFAAQKYVESDGKKAWQTPFQRAFGFKATEKVKPLDLAMQAYQERLFIEAEGKAGGPENA